MAISTSKQEIYAEGTTDISWTRLQTNSLLQGANDATNIRFGAYKRNPNDTSETPLVPDAEENADIATEESGNLRVGAFRGAIKRYDVTFDDASEYENVEFDKYFGANLVKNVPKELNVDGIIYSDDVTEPAAKIDTIDYSNDSIRNLTVGIGTSGAIYGAGAPAAPAASTEGISGGTALYVSSGTNSRNFTINLESSGGSFGKLYGGGGGGVTGSPGRAHTITCTRKDENPGPGIRNGVPVQHRIGTQTTFHRKDVQQNRHTPGTMNQAVHHGPFIQNTIGTVQGRGDHGAPGGVEWARDWNARAESFCRNRFGSNSHSADGGHGAPGENYNRFLVGDRDLPTSGNRAETPHFVQGQISYNCRIPAFMNPASRTQHTVRQTVSRTQTRKRSETVDITSAGGVGGPGGNGQGYQRAFTLGTEGSNAIQANCSDLDTVVGVSSYNSGSTTGERKGSPGTSGGDWGQDAPTSSVATGGLGGYAIKVANSDIAIQILGKDDSDKLKGRNNVERDDFT